jgi:protein TonB
VRKHLTCFTTILICSLVLHLTTLLAQDITLPNFPGGQKVFYKFLGKNLKWPVKGDYDGQGKVIVSFYVEKDGQLTNFKIERSLWDPFDNEALRVMRISPKWIPARQNGMPIDINIQYL